MDVARDSVLRTQLLDRRERLGEALVKFRESSQLQQLLNEVDSALERLDGGSYGVCEVCHDPIEKEWLAADPLVRTCLSHLTPNEQRAFEQDLDLASQVQRTLLPKRDLRFGGWAVYYHYEPAGPVSGDYCDLLYPEEEGGDFFFLLGDVSGKGVAASLLMSHLHAIFRSLTITGMPVSRLVERANRVFCESTMSTQFATLVCGRVTPFGEVEICNAGHCPPLWVRENTVTSIEATGLPLGIFCNGQYSVKEMSLSAGESLLLYTDGLSEAQDRTHAEYGVGRLSRFAGEQHSLSPQTLTQACLEDLATFQNGAPKTDDLTIMVIRRSE